MNEVALLNKGCWRSSYHIIQYQVRRIYLANLRSMWAVLTHFNSAPLAMTQREIGMYAPVTVCLILQY